MVKKKNSQNGATSAPKPSVDKPIGKKIDKKGDKHPPQPTTKPAVPKVVKPKDPEPKKQDGKKKQPEKKAVAAKPEKEVAKDGRKSRTELFAEAKKADIVVAVISGPRWVTTILNNLRTGIRLGYEKFPGTMPILGFLEAVNGDYKSDSFVVGTQSGLSKTIQVGKKTIYFANFVLYTTDGERVRSLHRKDDAGTHPMALSVGARRTRARIISLLDVIRRLLGMKGEVDSAFVEKVTSVERMLKKYTSSNRDLAFDDQTALVKLGRAAIFAAIRTLYQDTRSRRLLIQRLVGQGVLQGPRYVRKKKPTKGQTKPKAKQQRKLSAKHQGKKPALKPKSKKKTSTSKSGAARKPK